MSDEYSYRDARLSIWQSAAHQTHLKYPPQSKPGPTGPVANSRIHSWRLFTLWQRRQRNSKSH